MDQMQKEVVTLKPNPISKWQTALGYAIGLAIAAGVSYLVLSSFGIIGGEGGTIGAGGTGGTGGGSCIPGSDNCVEGCAQGVARKCQIGPSVTVCDCSHPWNAPSGPFGG